MYRAKFNRGLVWALLLAPCIAHAAGLGNLTVHSSLGQPLLAEIDLISVRKDEASTLIARLAPPEAYRKADLQYGAVLTGMRFTIEKRPSGEPYIKVMSTRSVNEPFVNLVVELSSSSGRFTREYTALIDPPGYTPPQSMAAAPVAPPAAEARPMAPRTAPAAVAAPAPVVPAKKEYTVKRGDTLSKIAASVKPEGIALEQMLVGIFRNNADAFMNSNMNLMKAGATLRIPENEQLTALSRQEAAKEVRVQTADWKQYRRRLSDRPGKASEKERSERKHDIRVKVEDKAASGKPKDVLKLSKGQPGDKKRRTIEDRVQALEEELIARERALNEANQRIKELEKTVKEGPK